MESFTAGEEDEAGRRTSDVAPGQESVETFHRPTLTLHNNPSRNVFSVFITKKKKKKARNSTHEHPRESLRARLCGFFRGAARLSSG